jgi:hypothetical protein
MKKLPLSTFAKLNFAKIALILLLFGFHQIFFSTLTLITVNLLTLFVITKGRCLKKSNIYFRYYVKIERKYIS